VAVDSSGTLWVVDTYNFRVLRFDDAANKINGAAADGVLGQPTFTTRSNATSAKGLNYPTSVAVDGNGTLWVTDNWSNRVLRFDQAASKPAGAAANGVLGQPDFTSQNIAATASGMNVPAGVAADTMGSVWVADRDNNRVLCFDLAASKPDGSPADSVLGQPDFTSAAAVTTASGMNFPIGMTVDHSGNVWVADVLNNRVLLFTDAPVIAISGNDQPIPSGTTTPDSVIGTDFGSLTLGQAITHTFMISNTGIITLTLRDLPVVSTDGATASDFIVTQAPALSVAPNGSTSFQVRFMPSAIGTQRATVSVANDSDMSVYAFTIQGTGTTTTNHLRMIYLPLTGL
jgi:hypothetical protein